MRTKYEMLSADQEGHLGLITLTRPSALNALNERMCEELADVASAWSAAGDVRTIIMTGAGEKAFVAGADIKEMADRTAQSSLTFLRKLHAAVNALEAFPYPVIAAIQGLALGGGCEVALARDLRIAADGARFGLPEINLGIVPGGGGTQRLPRLIGLAKARDLIYTGRMIPASEALQLGLVNRVVPADRLMSEARELAAELIAKAPVALRTAKLATRLSETTTLPVGLDNEVHQCALLWDTEDQREGMNAFVQKRPPRFAGQ